jgi:hypothetical protein
MDAPCGCNTPEVLQQALETRYNALLPAAALAFVKDVLVVDWCKRTTPAQLLQHPCVRE